MKMFYLKIIVYLVFISQSYAESVSDMNLFKKDYDLPSSYTTLRHGEDSNNVEISVYSFEGDGNDEFKAMSELSKSGMKMNFKGDKLKQLDEYIYGKFSDEEFPEHINLHDHRYKSFHILVKGADSKVGYVVLYGVKDKKGNSFAFLRRLVSEGQSDSLYPATALFKFLEQKIVGK